jgi:peptidoglycan/xylan/chitin deacetylase (PgdA/CDA1 family)
MSQDAGPRRQARRWLWSALLGLSLVVAAIAALWWWRGGEDAHEILAGELDPLADHGFIEALDASSHAVGHPPALVLDGRRAGALPHAWKPAGPGPAHLTITWRAPVSLRGVALDWAETPASYELLLDDTVVPVAPQTSGQHLAWLFAPQAASRLTVRIAGGDGALAEIAPIHDGMRTWLVSRDGSGDWEAEMLGAYGVPTLGRIAAPGAWYAVLDHARVVLVTNEAWDASGRAILRQFVQRGGTVIELGPRSRIADVASGNDAVPAAEEPARAGAGAYRIVEGALAGVRWPVAIAPDGPQPAGLPAEQLAEQLPGQLAEPPADVLVTAARGDTRAALVTRRRMGAGQVIRWHGDVGEAVRRLRQGDPALADRDVDGVGGIQPADLFAGQQTRADHDLPGADLLGFALLAQIASAPGPDVFVAALPGAADSLLVLTADQDFIPADAVRMQSEAAGQAGLTALLTAEEIGAPPDVSYDVAYARAAGGMIPRETAAALAGRGHEIGVHPNLWQLEPGAFASAIAAHADAFAANYGKRPALVRNHHLVWEGYTEMARHHAAAGLRMNLDYMALAIPPHGDLGFMSASALPMRFGEASGTVLPIHHQPTLLDDHVLLPAELGYQPYTLASLIARSRAVIDIARRHGLPVVVNHHPYFWLETGGAWQTALLAHARERGLAVWGAGAWLGFVERRRQTVVLDQGQGRFTVASAPGVTLLVEGTGAAPAAAGARVAERAPRLDGAPVAAAGRRSLAGMDVRLLTLPGGRHELEP